MKDVKIWSSREITGSIQINRTSKGKEYLYMVFNIYDEEGRFSQKWKSTGLLKEGNKKKAEKMLTETLIQLNSEREKIDRQREEEANNPLVCDCLDKFIEKIRVLHLVDEGTADAYEHRGKHIKSYFKGKRIRDITSKDVNEFCEYLLKAGHLKKETGEREPLNPVTVKDIKLVLGYVFDEAKVNGYVKENPAREVRISKKTIERTARKFFAIEMEEIENMFRFMESQNDPLTDMVKVIAYYGLRRSEAMAIRLDRESLDMENKVLHIKYVYTFSEKSGPQLKEAPKSESGIRNYALSDDMFQFFQSIIKKREENKEFFGNTFYDSGFLFTWADGLPFRHDYVTSHFEKVMKKLGYPNFTLHNLRHSCATFLYKEGLSIWDIGSWMGHKDPSTTKKWYANTERYANNMTAEKIAHKVKIMA